jgi:hypothetical protein
VKKELAGAGFTEGNGEGVEVDSLALVPPGWRGRVSELNGDALKVFWGEAMVYARREIGAYARWRGQDEPVLASGFDAAGLVQAAFERLLRRESQMQSEECKAKNGLTKLSAGDIRHELRVLIKHRVRWLHERSETRLVAGEWDVLPPRADGELVSVFEKMPGGRASPDQEVMKEEKQRLLGELKSGFEETLGRELLGVFERVWDGRQRQSEECKVKNEPPKPSVCRRRKKAMRAQVCRRLARYSGKARRAVKEMLEGEKGNAK